MSDIRFYVAAVLICLGLLFSCSAVFGVWRYRDSMLKLHVSAVNDTMGMSLLFLGLAVLSGLTNLTAKLLCVLAIYWMASPISGHLLAKMRVRN